MPPGHKLCNDAFSLWLKQHQDLADFNIIDKKSCRARLLWIIDNLDKIERWRATRSVSERAAWNSPSTTYRVAHCKQRGLPEFRNPTSSEQKNGKADEALPGSWSKLLVIADEAWAYEKVKKRMPAEMAEPGNVQTIRDGGKALLAIADQLEKMSEAARQREGPRGGTRGGPGAPWARDSGCLLGLVIQHGFRVRHVFAGMRTLRGRSVLDRDAAPGEASLAL